MLAAVATSPWWGNPRLRGRAAMAIWCAISEPGEPARARKYLVALNGHLSLHR